MLSDLQSNLREALLSHSVEYRKTYLTALATVMARGDSAVPQHPEEPVLPECLNLLLGDLGDQQCGSEFLSQTLCATSLLLSQWPDSRFDMALLFCSFVFFFYVSIESYYRAIHSSLLHISLKAAVLQRWCTILECHRLPDSPEVLRMACADALCVAGVPLLSQREHSKAIASRCERTPTVLVTT